MVTLGRPAIDLVFTGGRFSSADAQLCAAYFAVFSVSLCLWSAQSIYARAFYAAGNTMTPMVAGTIVTLVSLPIYSALYHWQGAIGLAIASDIGIALQTVIIALLLHQRHMVSLASLDYAELGRSLAAALASGAGVWMLVLGLDWLSGQLWGPLHAAHLRWADLALLLAGTALWVAITKWVLERTGSALPRVMMRRLNLG